MPREYAWNYQKDGPFIKERTAHIVAERDGRSITADCGFSFRVTRLDRDVESLHGDAEPRDRHKCGNCRW